MQTQSSEQSTCRKRDFKSLKVALISDELTRSCLYRVCRVKDVTALNYRFLLRLWRPDLLLVESAWQGHRNAWKYRIAAYPDRPERTNSALARVVNYARDRGIPTVFWNKEDGVHFSRFIESARLFDHIFTVDENCIERYKQIAGPGVTVNELMFAVEPSLHYYKKTDAQHQYRQACFVGSYSKHIHPGRRELQHMLFEAAASHIGLTVFDRNSGRSSDNYRYPGHIPMSILPAVPYIATGRIYKDYIASLNVNTVTDSPTMFSRRLVEILACGGLAVTTPALSVDRLFAPYCHVIRSKEEASELFARLKKDGLSPRDREMVVSGAEYVAKHHTWEERLERICQVARV